MGTCAARSRKCSRAGRISVAPEYPSSSKTHSGGTSSPERSAASCSAAVWEAIVWSSFWRADETRAYIAGVVIAAPLLYCSVACGHENPVGVDTRAGPEPVEDGLDDDVAFSHGPDGPRTRPAPGRPAPRCSDPSFSPPVAPAGPTPLAASR